MTNVWFTSDPHWGHRMVAGIRGFDDPADHDDWLSDGWNEVVGPKDQVWVLGDISVSPPGYALSRIRELPGDKHLIWGNHDAGHPMHRKAHKDALKYMGVFSSASQSARRRVNGQEVLLSHFPYEADRDELRYAQWRLPNFGTWLLHGHTHSTRKITSSREIHVGVDAWGGQPVSLITLEKIMALPLDDVWSFE